ILPVLLATAAITLGSSWWYSRRIRLPAVTLGWRETLATGRRLATLGSAFMWSGVMMAALDIFTRTLITRQEGVEAAGFYQAAWALSGLFAGFILSAMGTDFYPRLTGVIHDHQKATELVNQQTEIGILLALPGLLATLALSPWLLHLFYSEAFQPGADLLPWFVLGIFGRIISWPLGFIQLALGASRAFAITETVFVIVHLGLVAWLVPLYGAVGAAYGFAIAYGIYAVMMTVVARWLIRYSPSNPVNRQLAISAIFVALSFVGLLAVGGLWGSFMAGVIAVVAGALSIRGIVARASGQSVISAIFKKKLATVQLKET
ncbi:MAG: polysaccharide biosynthesis C-terminal domain-containing protein, partial [Porticoccaceae bacterium]|nr:polysaccharide biosynthesis C-terminal domain-containing protein [Porticoccaceae bacterium]